MEYLASTINIPVDPGNIVLANFYPNAAIANTPSFLKLEINAAARLDKF